MSESIQSIENNVEHVRESRNALGGKYLTYILDGNDFGVAILEVREIIALHAITPLPRLPEFVRGVINLRGKIIPVIDLRIRLGLMAKEDDRSTCIVVLDVDLRNGVTSNIGCIVDTVSEVADIPADAIQAPPSFGNGVRTDYIQGLAKLEGGKKVVTLVDMDVVLGGLLGEAGLLEGAIDLGD